MEDCLVLFANGTPVCASLSCSASDFREYLEEVYAEDLEAERISLKEEGTGGQQEVGGYLEDDSDEYGYRQVDSLRELIDDVCGGGYRVSFGGSRLALERMTIDEYYEEEEAQMKTEDPDYESDIDPSLFKEVRSGSSVWIAYYDNWSTYEPVGAFSSPQPNVGCDYMDELTLI